MTKSNTIFSFPYSQISDSDDDEDSRQWQEKHQEDILSLSSYQNSLIATSSYDGDIYIWSLETAHALCKLNANESIKPRTGSHTISAGVDEIRRGSIDKLARRSSAGSQISYKSGGKGSDDESVHGKSDRSQQSVPVTTVGSKAGDGTSCTTLPAIEVHRGLVDRRNSANREDERAAAGSRTFFTESINGGIMDREEEHEKENVEDKEKWTIRDKMFNQKHESAVDKVSITGLAKMILI